MKSIVLILGVMFSANSFAGNCNIRFTDHKSGEEKFVLADTKVGTEVEGFAHVRNSKDPVLTTANYEIYIVNTNKRPGIVVKNLNASLNLARVGSITGQAYYLFNKSIEIGTFGSDYDLATSCKR